MIAADVPLETLFGYAIDIRSLSKGRANYALTPSRYAVAPSHLVPVGAVS